MATKSASQGSHQFGSAHSHSDLHHMEIIEDRTGSRRKHGQPAKYSKGRFLGKGGFAKCYEVQDLETKEIFAAKIVAKASISKPRAHAKLRSEISIHRSLDHEKVVHFYDYFEDSEYVYIILELCPNQTLNEFMRKRPSKRLSEQEGMFYLYDLIMALKYLHKRRVIHRDLKLGNLFLDENVRIKVGDFGLAAQLEHDGEKKRTICGTPNYIAPEILEGKTGHSYEVDIWSLGVILYTMLVGRPPFETNDVKTTYKRIRYNQYSFPDAVRLSDQAKDLISAILRTDPRSRPSLDDILAAPWFQNSRLPPSIPVTISGYSASPRPTNASARSETPERAVQDHARIDSPAPRFPLRDRSPGVASQSPLANGAPHRLPPQGPVLGAKNPALTPNSGGTTPGRFNGTGVGRPPLAHRGNEENVVPSNAHNAAVDTYKDYKDVLANGGPAVSPSPTQSQAFGGLGTALSPCRNNGTAHGAGNGRAGQAPQSYTPHGSTQLGMQRAAHHSHQPPPSSAPSRESSPLVSSAVNSMPTKVVAHGYSSSRSATSSPRQPLQSSGRLGSTNLQSGSTAKDSRSARILGQPTTEQGTGSLFTKTTPAVLRGTATQPVASRKLTTVSSDSPRPSFCSQAQLTPCGGNATSEIENLRENVRTGTATPPQTQDKRPSQFSLQSSVTSARRKERSSSSPALLVEGDTACQFEPTTPAAPFAMVGSDGSTSYRKAPESIRGFPSCRSTGIGSPAEVNFAACLSGSEPPSSRSSQVVQIQPGALPELWVTKWVDYSSKYGVGYILSDESIGVYFNDSTKIILCPEGDRFDYITRRTQEKAEIRTSHTFEEYPDDLKKKVTLLRHFRNYMLTDILEKKDGASVGESSLPKVTSKDAKSSKISSDGSDAGQAPYVKKWTRNKHAIMFQLSNKIVQVVFFDKTEAVLSSKSHMVTYIDKKGSACSYPLSNVLDVPSPELAKRLRYTKDILVNLLGARTSELGGA